MDNEMKLFNDILENIKKYSSYGEIKISNDVYSILNKLKNNYAIYIGKKSIERLIYFIYGYMERMSEKDDSIPSFLGFDFQCYIINIYGDLTHHWSDIIQSHSESEEIAFDKFYEHLEDYLKLNNIEFAIEQT